MAAIREACPDCGGTGRLRVTFHDETQVSIACQNCAVGYDPPTGRVTIHRSEGFARTAVVSGFENAHGKFRWHVDSAGGCYRIIDDEDAFESEAPALAKARMRAAEYQHTERKRIAHKEKDTRSWAWNASYHRRCIKEAQKQIEYHTAKLNVAAIKAKEDA
jgi:hypothetical protein